MFSSLKKPATAIPSHLTLALKRYQATAAIKKPLEGVRVLELGQIIAGPFCGSILGYYGAEIIKIEPPKNGDPLRSWRHLDKDGQSPWFRSMARNKKSVCIDIRTEEGRGLVKKLAGKVDVLIENFKPGTMEKWGLGPDDLYAINKSLIYTRISGYGQTGPYSKRPGFASVCEGMGGFRSVNGYPGEPPVRPNISLGDSLAGLHAAFGVVLGLLARNKLKQSIGESGRTGQVVDVSIYESVLNMMESIIPEFDRFNEIRQPSGTTLTGIVPTNTYPCKDGKYVIIGGNGDSIYNRLMNAIGRSDLAIQEQKTIDGAIADWTSTLPSEEILAILEKASVPSGKIYDAKDIVEDEHINARGMIETVTVGTAEDGRGWDLKIPGMSPVLELTPGSTEWAGPDLGAHTHEVLESVLGLSKADIEALDTKNVTKA
ncbi:CAIB/BAIF family protein [Phycomyces nitens]|nr:CAIB/BAIF family protein [Phycomyces nitens]